MTGGLIEQFPQAGLTFDRFQRMRWLPEAVDHTRREEQKTHPARKGTPYVWLKNDGNRAAKQQAAFEALRSSKRVTVRATPSRLAPVVKAAGTFRTHWDGERWGFVSRLTHGVREAVNGLPRSAKTRVRGFCDNHSLITRVYLIAGNPDFNLPELGYAAQSK